MSNSPYDYTSDEPAELKENVWGHLSDAPTVLAKWFAINLQRLVNNPGKDYDIQKAIPVLQDIYDLLVAWQNRHIIHAKNEDMQSVRYWWGLFMHLYGPKKGN